jgi:hypothetical protein
MTPLKKTNSQLQFNLQNIRNEPYLIINLILAGVIILVMLYSGIFSPLRDNYPVVCLHERLTGEPCISCGLSHSFSLLVRGKWAESYSWNTCGLRVFLFFASQLLMRLVYSFYYIRDTLTRDQLVILDIAGSSVLFLIAFLPFIRSLI